VTQPFGHVACWVDGTAAGTVALAMSVSLWRHDDGRLSLLHATGPGETRGAQRLRKDWERGRGRTLAGAEPVFIADDPATAICDWARREEPDVIVVGAGAGRPPGRDVGNLAGELVERAPCAVLVVQGSPKP
jgi:nucleotide-binding universal stress UspA family protein